MNTYYMELEAILTFLGIEFIDFKGKRTSNGHKTAKTIEEIKNFFGKEVMTTGQFIKDIDWWDFKNDWNDLMFLTEKIEESGFLFDIFKKSASIHTTEGYTISDISGKAVQSKKIATYSACIDFLKWYNKNNKKS